MVVQGSKMRFYREGQDTTRVKDGFGRTIFSIPGEPSIEIIVDKIISKKHLSKDAYKWVATVTLDSGLYLVVINAARTDGAILQEVDLPLVDFYKVKKDMKKKQYRKILEEILDEKITT